MVLELPARASGGSPGAVPAPFPPVDPPAGSPSLRARVLVRGHATVVRAAAGGSREAGQGTVEYVALILLVAVLLAGVVAAARGATGETEIAATLIKKLKEAISDVK